MYVIADRTRVFLISLPVAAPCLPPPFFFLDGILLLSAIFRYCKKCTVLKTRSKMVWTNYGTPVKSKFPPRLKVIYTASNHRHIQETDKF